MWLIGRALLFGAGVLPEGVEELVGTVAPSRVPASAVCLPTRRWAVPRRAFWRIMGQTNDFPARDKRVAGGEGKGESSWMRK